MWDNVQPSKINKTEICIKGAPLEITTSYT